MDRVSMVKQYVDEIILRLPSVEERTNAFIHTYGVAGCCSLIAGRRCLNTEIAYISGLLHDIYAYFTGSYMCHSQSGADMARVAISKMNIFSDEEKTTILSAIFYHANIDVIHDDYDEILKDANILQSFLADSCSGIFYLAEQRLVKILSEFNIKASPVIYGQGREIKSKLFSRSAMADIAEAIAAKGVRGERSEEAFMDIIKYYPEETAFDELKNSWCAAFVYHCALKSGLELPIRQPPVKNRFAGVGPWFEWGKINQCCFYIKDGFTPLRGDIVIYNNVIPPENKPPNGPWHDHIGVVLSFNAGSLAVAEGNVNNQNVSGIVSRTLNSTIGCFIRISENYIYDGCKHDYKSYLKHLL